MFNERKAPDTMYCFLVTFLPDESYTGNPALRSSNPLGSDYSGLAIYSYPDGTPAWGWRYDTGEITHTLPFDESYRNLSDPEYRLRIDFGSDEYSTRGLDDVNNLDEVLVPGYKPVPTPDLYGLTETDQAYLLNLYGEIGGGGGGPSNNTPQPTVKMDDKTKEKIKPLLDKIDKDCLGQLLMNYANQNGISITYDPTFAQGLAGTYQSTGNIIWSDGAEYDFMIFEELFHSYQIKSGGFNKEYPGNMEIEAKVATWKYMDRLGQVFRHDKEAWDMIGEYAQNPTLENYSKAITALGRMGYYGINVNSTLANLLPNYNKINPCND